MVVCVTGKTWTSQCGRRIIELSGVTMSYLIVLLCVGGVSKCRILVGMKIYVKNILHTQVLCVTVTLGAGVRWGSFIQSVKITNLREKKHLCRSFPFVRCFALSSRKIPDQQANTSTFEGKGFEGFLVFSLRH
jgi:hypothetical protein